MELRHLRYFTAVAELGSFTAAARRLHVAQSSVSEQIADLEHELGAPLLNRSGRQTRLTPLGSVFLEEALRTLAAADRAIEVTRRSMRGETGTLSIGFFVGGAGSFFPRLIREYRRRHPGIRLSLLEMSAVQQIQALEQGRLDVGLTRPPDASADRILHSELLFRDPVVVAVRPDHRFAGKTVRLQELVEERLVLAERAANTLLFDSVLALCAAEGLTPTIANTSTTWSGVLTLVESGEGVALVPAGMRSARTRGVSFCKLLPETLFLGLSVVWNPRHTGPALEAFLHLLRENKERIQRSGGS
ncbi:MAG: LysR family transcriptional regulator [Janthinobacterium lividum]